MSIPNFYRWDFFYNDIKERLKTPAEYPEFIIYFFVVVFLTGMVGIYLTIYIENKLTAEVCFHNFSHIHVALSISSYFIALLTASAVDLILSIRKVVEILQRPYIMLGLASIIIGLCLMGGVLLNENNYFYEYLFSVIGLILSWFIWWISNSRNHNLVINPSDATPTPEHLTGNQENYNL